MHFYEGVLEFYCMFTQSLILKIQQYNKLNDLIHVMYSSTAFPSPTDFRGLLPVRNTTPVVEQNSLFTLVFSLILGL